jgi:hypothetical protein
MLGLPLGSSSTIPNVPAVWPQCFWRNRTEITHKLAELRERLKPVDEVYKKWDKKGDRELLHRPRLLAQELWQAIKAACEGE